MIIAHRLSTVEIADRVLVLSAGRVVEDGPPARLLAADGDYSACTLTGGTASPSRPPPSARLAVGRAQAGCPSVM